MGKIRTTFAAMLTILALTAFQSDAYAQTRRESRSSSRSTGSTKTSTQKSSGSSVSRSSSSSNRKSTATRPSSQNRQSTSVRSSGQSRQSITARPSASSDRKSSTATRPATGTNRQPATTARPSAGSDRKPSTATRPATRPSDRPTAAKPADRPSDRPATRPVDRSRYGGKDRPMQQIRPDHKPNPHRKHPHDRDFVPYHKPSHYWSHHNHCFGYRVRVLPAHCVRHYYHGHVYYCYNDIWYRPYGGHYVVCRPPFGTVLAANLIADMNWAAVNYSYYNTIANAYDRIDENNRYIAEQNAIIAQNNATIAAQNQTLAMNQQLASQAYTLANDLGLIQSYAAANGSYYYQDGIFYVMDAKGEYKTIVPPAGALVESLPDDYEMVTLKGNEYYKVDDTVYKITLSDGKPYFEVLGQLYR